LYECIYLFFTYVAMSLSIEYWCWKTLKDGDFLLKYPFWLCYLFAIFVSFPANQRGHSCAKRWPVKDSDGTWNFCPTLWCLFSLYFFYIQSLMRTSNFWIMLFNFPLDSLNIKLKVRAEQFYGFFALAFFLNIHRQ
jgi:hypothetical protein